MSLTRDVRNYTIKYNNFRDNSIPPAKPFVMNDCPGLDLRYFFMFAYHNLTPINKINF